METSPKLFVGRAFELEQLEQLKQKNSAQIIVVYGRRRVGKTTLIHKAFEDRALIKFEGLENQPTNVQRTVFFERMSAYFNITHKTASDFANWRDLLVFLYDYIKTGEKTVYLEEFQWMAEYSDELISDLKYIWDNYWSKNPKLVLIICGSAPSFLIDKVMHSKALYNRSQREFSIEELSLAEVGELLGKSRSKSEILDAYLGMGGIPEYVQYLKDESSVYLSICKNSFIKNGFFANEFQRIFVSNLAQNPNYKNIIETLALRGSMTKVEIVKQIGAKMGGGITDVFSDLLKCNFIGVYAPIAYGVEKRLSKYYLRDSYLHFYYRFIKPLTSRINNNDFHKNYTQPLNNRDYRQWLGYSFERFCLKINRQIAEMLGFSGVEYSLGPMYLRNDQTKTQIDLVFQRKDKVLTICEIKYQETPPDSKVIDEFERKIRVLDKFRNYSIQKILISPNGVSKDLFARHYFDRIIGLEELLPG